jgi:hypothetical protein
MSFTTFKPSAHSLDKMIPGNQKSLKLADIIRCFCLDGTSSRRGILFLKLTISALSIEYLDSFLLYIFFDDDDDRNG